MKRHSEKGSALLIVLGFLSFMVVSAVAFAVWMRTERLPSSALRRNVANRYLVKAALAQAMSRVDDAVRSHVFPGAWNTGDQSAVYRDANGSSYDWWEGGVFMPPDPEGLQSSTDSKSRYAPASKTVSVLNMEALGYLPPAIANDVRLLHRSSWAAAWDYFNFDAGRYAFCAVNVSDMLDVNKVAADAPRTSAAVTRPENPGEKPPPSRFSFAYLFRDGDNFSSLNNGAKQFDKSVHENREEWKEAPLVSLMDYNLSIGPNAVGDSLWSPFYYLAHGDNKKGLFYRYQSRDDGYVQSAARQPFVTDSWFPSNDLVRCGKAIDTPLDISQEDNWPFPSALMQNEKANLDNVFLDSNEDLFWKPIIEERHALCALDRFSLFDYLDENDVPLSLAIPCVERVPMLTALAPLPLGGNLTVEFDSSQPPEDEPDPNDSANFKRKVTKINIKITLGGMGMRSTVVYPFSGGDTPGAFTTEAFARLVFVGTESESEPTVFLRNNGLAKACRPTREDWNNDDKGTPFSLDGKNQNALFITLPSETPQSWTPPRYMASEQNCWHDQVLTFKDVGAQLPKEGVTIIRKIQYYKITKDSQGNITGEDIDPARKEPFYEIVLRPFGENGELLSIPEGEMEKAKFDEISNKYKIYPYLVAWARVKNDKGDTVDLVPATFEDDQTYNKINNQVFADNAGDTGRVLGHNAQTDRSDSMPIMRFPGEKPFTYNDAQTGSPLAGNTWRVKSCYAVDPRFNWAPENWWFDSSDDTPTGQEWCDAVFGKNMNVSDQDSILNKLVAYEFGAGYERGDRATDPFLFVSNLGYLQSVGELAFLPHLSNMSEDSIPKTVLGDPNGSSATLGSLYNGKERVIKNEVNPDRAQMESLITDSPCALSAWKSYRNYRTNPNGFEFGANLYRRGFVNGELGFYVNPYTRNNEVMLAALANPPLNYWAAGENYDWKTKKLRETKLAFSDNSELMFGAGGTPALNADDLNKVATFLRHRFEDLSRMIKIPEGNINAKTLYVYQKAWEDMFDALDWGGRFNKNVGEVYQDLADYYNSDSNGNLGNYSDWYKKRNAYSGLNCHVRGKENDSFNVKVNFDPDKAAYASENADPFFGTTLEDKLHDVDRMFLHSYWRDCFANRQQLFLIFVRAEATALGAAGEGTPPQQGGRAVALVWRDPLPTFNNSSPTEFPSLAGDVYEQDNQTYREDRRPHKMRILFYRQFD